MGRKESNQTNKQTTENNGLTGPTSLESYGTYFEILGQWPRPTINPKAWSICL